MKALNIALGLALFLVSCDEGTSEVPEDQEMQEDTFEMVSEEVVEDVANEIEEEEVEDTLSIQVGSVDIEFTQAEYVFQTCTQSVEVAEIQICVSNVEDFWLYGLTLKSVGDQVFDRMHMIKDGHYFRGSFEGEIHHFESPEAPVLLTKGGCHRVVFYSDVYGENGQEGHLIVENISDLNLLGDTSGLAPEVDTSLGNSLNVTGVEEAVIPEVTLKTSNLRVRAGEKLTVTPNPFLNGASQYGMPPGADGLRPLQFCIHPSEPMTITGLPMLFTGTFLPGELTGRLELEFVTLEEEVLNSGELWTPSTEIELVSGPNQVTLMYVISETATIGHTIDSVTVPYNWEAVDSSGQQVHPDDMLSDYPIEGIPVYISG